jgi:DNA-binding IclR family transcriptional regulator
MAPRGRSLSSRVATALLDPSEPKSLDLRVTYRTLRTLRAIAEQPASSNREVAAAAGVADQGQMSKLLWRLEGLGLIRNAGRGHVMGGPNAWRLTARGEEFERAFRGVER